MSELPENWVGVNLFEICDVIRGITFPASAKQAQFSDSNVCCLRTSNVQREIKWNDVYFVSESYVKNQDQIVQVNDILMSMANSYDLVGKVAIVKETPYRSAFGAFLAAIRPSLSINNKYLFFFLRSSDVQSELRKGSSQTTNIANISAKKLSEIAFPLPPLNEQKRIADKLEQLLERVTSSLTRLETAESILKRFRQSVLAAATNGKLTENWREENGISSEWETNTLSELCISITDGDHQAPPQVEKGIPFITISAINDGNLNLEKATRHVSLEYYQKLKDSRKPKRGDILYSVTGSVGIPAIVKTDVEFTFQRHIAILKPDANQIISEYLWCALSSDALKKTVLEFATGTAQLTIPLNGLRALAVNIPPLPEQLEIVRRVEILFGFADQLEKRIQTARTALERSTPSILAKAFRGELVPQDPMDEPASVLLERIQKTRAADSVQLKQRKPRQTKIKSIKAGDETMKRLEDVPNDHLIKTIKERDPNLGTLEAKTLWQASELSIDDFYLQLNREVTNGLLRVNGDQPAMVEVV